MLASPRITSVQPSHIFAKSKRRHSIQHRRPVNLSANKNEPFTKPHHVESALFEYFLLKHTLLELFDEIKKQDSLPDLSAKFTAAEEKMEKFQEQIEGMANSLVRHMSKNRTDKKAQTAQREELAKSLKELELAYSMNKQRLTRDLNKMEQQLTHLKDTRERIEIKHLKFSDIAQREFEKIMPNDLTQSIKFETKRRSRGRTASEKLNSFASDSEQMSSMEQIRQDLDDADNVFAMVYGGKIIKKAKTVLNEQGQLVEVLSPGASIASGNDGELGEKPSFEWLPSSSSENHHVEDPLQSFRDQDGKIKESSEALNVPGIQELKALEKARDRLITLQKESDVNNSVLQNQVLQQQLIEIQIQQKKRMIISKQNQQKASRSHRQEIQRHAFKAFQEHQKLAFTNNLANLNDNEKSATSSLVVDKSEFPPNPKPMSRDPSSGGESSDNMFYLATDPQLQINLGMSFRKSPFMSGSPMSLKSSTYNSKVGFDHKTMLCMSPPAAVNGAPLPTTGGRNSTSRHERKNQIRVPNINLKSIVKAPKDPQSTEKLAYTDQTNDPKPRLKTPSPAPSKTTNNTSIKQSILNTEHGASRNQDSTFISLTPNDPFSRKITIGEVPRIKVVRQVGPKDFFTQPQHQDAKPQNHKICIKVTKGDKAKGSVIAQKVEKIMEMQVVPKQAILVKDQPDAEAKEVKITKKNLQLEMQKKPQRLYEQLGQKPVKIDFRPYDE